MTREGAEIVRIHNYQLNGWRSDIYYNRISALNSHSQLDNNRDSLKELFAVYDIANSTIIRSKVAHSRIPDSLAKRECPQAEDSAAVSLDVQIANDAVFQACKPRPTHSGIG